MAQRQATNSSSKQSPAWRGHFRSQFLKTQLCRFHPAGLCKFGKDCCFAHSPDELSTAPDLTKTSMCKMWQEGKCDLSGDQCQFAHGPTELRVTPAFVKKKLSRRTRTASMDDVPCNPQDGEVDAGRTASATSVETSECTTEPGSPLRRCTTTSTSSGFSTPASQSPPSPYLPANEGGPVAKAASQRLMAPFGCTQPATPNVASNPVENNSGKPVLCLSDILGGRPAATGADPRTQHAQQPKPQGKSSKKGPQAPQANQKRDGEMDAQMVATASLGGKSPYPMQNGFPPMFSPMATTPSPAVQAAFAAALTGVPAAAAALPHLPITATTPPLPIPSAHAAASMAAAMGNGRHPARISMPQTPQHQVEAAKVPVSPALAQSFNCFGSEVDSIILAAQRSSLPLRVDIDMESPTATPQTVQSSPFSSFAVEL